MPRSCPAHVGLLRSWSSWCGCWQQQPRSLPRPVTHPSRPRLGRSTPPIRTGSSGTGRRASCTSKAVVRAVARGGIIRFDCGPGPVTIRMQATARVFNDRPDVVLDGGGQVTLDGQGARRILYMNTCDPEPRLDHAALPEPGSPHPHGAEHHLPQRPLERRRDRWTEAEPSSSVAAGSRWSTRGSTAIAARPRGPDVGGAAIQVFSQHQGRPVYVVNSIFGGPDDRRNACSNGGAISSIGVSWTILNSLFQDNRAIGSGANPPPAGTPGGGNGGAIYNDGNEHDAADRGHDDQGQSLQRRGRERHLLRQQRPHGASWRSWTRSSGTTRGTDSPPIPASSSWAGASPSRAPRSSESTRAPSPTFLRGSGTALLSAPKRRRPSVTPASRASR